MDTFPQIDQHIAELHLFRKAVVQLRLLQSGNRAEHILHRTGKPGHAVGLELCNADDKIRFQERCDDVEKLAGLTVHPRGLFPGEILVKGPVVMMGYYKNPEKTAEVLTEDGWFSTGDYGKYDREAERLYITGRKKNIIVLKNGKNIYPEEIEDYLTGRTEIEEVIVSAVKDEDGGEIGLQAEIYPFQERIADMDEKAASDFIKGVVDEYNKTMPAHKRIMKVVVRTEPIEKTTSGKIRRKYN